MTQSGQTGYQAAPTASSGGSMSNRAQWGFGIDDLTRLLGDSKRYEVFNFRVRAVAGENAVKPGTLVKRLGVGERLLLADKSLFLRKSRRDLVEVRKAFVFADRRRQLYWLSGGQRTLCLGAPLAERKTAAPLRPGPLPLYTVRSKHRSNGIGAAMPRYYFHLTDGKQVLNNHKGIDLSGNAAARDDALALARDLKLGAVMPGWDWSGWFVTIVDGHGHKVDEVPIADV